jgi:hypothetical protein
MNTRMVFVAVFSLAILVYAQKGSAPTGFYPAKYNGDTFRGNVVDADEQGHLTLEYSKGSKHEQFTGITEAPCMGPTKDRGLKQLHLAAIPKGTILMAFYNPLKAKDSSGQKEVNSILAIRFDVVNGPELPDPSRPVIVCSNPSAGMKVFNEPDTRQSRILLTKSET